MAEAFVQLPVDSTGKKAHMNSRTIGADLQHDEYTLAGEPFYASYSVDFDAISIATLGDDIIQIMAGGALNARVRSIDLTGLNATAVSLRAFQIARVTTAGTGGTVVTASKMDNADGAYSGACASGVPNATHGAIGAVIRTARLAIYQALLATSAQALDRFHWEQKPGMKPIIIPAGATNGLVIRNVQATAGGFVSGTIELVETPFV